MSSTSSERPVKPLNAIAYGIGDLYGGGSFFIVSTLAMYYLVAVVGMSPLWAALVPGLGKVWDAISDPLMGYISDKTKSQFGRRRVWFLAAIVPVAVTFSLVWLPVREYFPDLFSTDFAAFIYYFSAFLLFYTISTMTMVPYSALAADMAVSFKERNKLTSTRMVFSILSVMIAASVAQPIVNMFVNPYTGYLVMGTVFSCFYALPWIFVFFGTWELPQAQSESEMNLSIFANFVSIFRNKSFRIHIYMYVCAYAAMDIMMGWLLFYLTDCIGKPEYFNKLLPALVVAELLFVPVYSMISHRFGHARSFMIGMIIWMLGMAGMAFAQNYPLWLLVVNCLVIGAGLSAGVVIPFNILPFVTDVDELMTTHKRAGTYSGAMTLIRKLIQGALVLPLLGVLLSVIDYKQLESDQKALLTSSNQILGVLQNFDQTKKLDVVSAKMISASDRMRKSAEKADSLSPAEKLSFVQAAADIEVSARSMSSAPDFAAANEQAVKMRETASAVQSRLKVEQGSFTKEMMRILFVFSPIVLLIMGFFFSLRFRINSKTHDVLVREIDRLRKGGRKEDVSPETKKICETLTGHAYEDLWK